MSGGAPWGSITKISLSLYLLPWTKATNSPPGAVLSTSWRMLASRLYLSMRSLTETASPLNPRLRNCWYVKSELGAGPAEFSTANTGLGIATRHTTTAKTMSRDRSPIATPPGKGEPEDYGYVVEEYKGPSVSGES